MKTRTILTVDDEEKNVKLLKTMLMKENYRLAEAHSVDEALKKVIETLPDLILLDVLMPLFNGIEVCRRLKEDKRTKMIPIIMVTAPRDKEHHVRAMEAGADDFLSKPVDQTELLVRVKR